jgi:adenylate kinase
MKPHLIILGAPGSGKGTQAAKLVEKGYKHVSTGDLLRSEIAKGSELGQKVSGIISRGDLVDDSTVMALLKANCDVDQVSYIFDGFPRNLEQAKMLENQLLKEIKRLTEILCFNTNLYKCP